MGNGWRKTAIVAVVAALVTFAAAVPAAEARPGAANGVQATPSATRPAATPQSAQDFENSPLVFSDAQRDPMRQNQRASSVPSIFSVLFYVFVISGIFLFIIWLMKRYLPGHRQLFSHPAIEVLGRTHLDQRRYVSLLRVGRRILVVGVSPDTISPLSEIEDGEEVAEILELARPKTEAGRTLFQKLFQRHMIDAEQDRAEAELDTNTEQLASDISDLRDRIRARREEGNPGGVDRLG